MDKAEVPFIDLTDDDRIQLDRYGEGNLKRPNADGIDRELLDIMTPFLGERKDASVKYNAPIVTYFS